jgi:hypothetical protein
MAFDAEAYRRDVVDPARKRGGIPADPFERYGMDDRGPPPGAELFGEHVKAVVKYWRALKLKKTYAAVADALLAAHAELDRAGEVTPEAFARRRTDVRRAATEALDRKIEALAVATPCIGPAAFERLLAGTAGVLDEHAVRASLRRHNLDVLDHKWDVPVEPPSHQARALRAPLDVLGLRLSVDVLFGADAVRSGFHLRDGFMLAHGRERVTEEKITEVRQARARNVHDERRTAAENILSIISAALREPGLLDATVTWEVAEALRADVEAGLPARLIADQAAELGLVRTEANQFAATLAETASAPAAGRARIRETYDALASGHLRAAQQLVAALPDEADRADVARHVEAALARLAGLVREADRAQAAGDAEQAADLLARACDLARDDEDLAQRLRVIPPPPPVSVHAAPDGHAASVRWEPSPARVGEVRYQVVRSIGRTAATPGAGEVVAARTGANTVVDTSPPVGETVYYTVFASREEGIWSGGAAGNQLVLLPDVDDFVLVADEASVTGSWRAHPGAADITVTRTAHGRTGGHIQLSSVTPTGFSDSDVRSGTTYDYTVRVVYRARDGARRTSKGVVAAVRPQAPPSVVGDLVVEHLDDQPPRGGRSSSSYSSASSTSSSHGSTSFPWVSWAPPSSGITEVRVASAAPQWSVGARVPVGDVAGYGRVLQGAAARRGDGRLAMPVALQHGRYFLTAVTSAAGDARATVGNTVHVSLVDGVSNLSATRFDDVVKLRWTWPAGATLARVRWWASEGTSGTSDASRASGASGAFGAAAGAFRSAGAVDAAGAGDEKEAATGGETDVRLRSFTDDGGATITVGPGAVRVCVQTVIKDDGGETVSPPATVDVTGRAVTLRYALRRPRLRWSRRTTLVLTSETSCRLPPLVVVGRADGILPLSPAKGRVVARIAAMDVTAGVKKRVRVPIPGGRRAGALACFVDQVDQVDQNAPPGDGWAPVTLVRSGGGR